MNRGKWLVIEVRCPRQEGDKAVELLWQYETTGVEELEEGDRLCLRAFFEPTQTALNLIEVLEKEIGVVGEDLFELTASWVEFDTEEWIKNYRAHFQGISVDDLFYIYPSWGTPPAGSKLHIQIEPSHAFGTGTHESTQLALKAIYALAPSAARIADVGTGSGILAIAAAILNLQAEIVAFDNSSQSIEAARENVIANKQCSRVRLIVGEPESIRSHFDLVVANLTLEIFRDIAGGISTLCSRDLVLSGFTGEQEDAVLYLFRRERGFRLNQRWREEGWSCFHLVRNP